MTTPTSSAQFTPRDPLWSSWVAQQSRKHPIIATSTAYLLAFIPCYPLQTVSFNLQHKKVFKISVDSLLGLARQRSVYWLGPKNHFTRKFLIEGCRWGVYRGVANYFDRIGLPENAAITTASILNGALEPFLKTPFDKVAAKAATCFEGTEKRISNSMLPFPSTRPALEELGRGLVPNMGVSMIHGVVWSLFFTNLKDIYLPLVQKRRELRSSDFLVIGATTGVLHTAFAHTLITYRVMHQVESPELKGASGILQGLIKIKEDNGGVVGAAKRLYRGFVLALIAGSIQSAVAAWLYFNVHSPKMRRAEGKEKRPEPSSIKRERPQDNWSELFDSNWIVAIQQRKIP